MTLTNLKTVLASFLRGNYDILVAMILKSEAYKHTVDSVNTFLESYFATQIEAAKKVDASYERLWQTMRTVTKSGGKRMRPYLTTLAYQLSPDNDKKRILPVAVAHELLHTAVLMHDDIIDHDLVRHGTKNISGLYNDLYRTYDGEESLHYANSAAILSGDLLISAAYTLIVNSEFEIENKLDALRLMSVSIFDVVGGELMDVESSFILDHEYDPLVVYKYKTASYSFVGPLLSGAVLGGADKKTQDALRLFGQNLGIAFQLVDDLIGVFGNETKTGKTTVGDLQEGKQTYLIKSFYKLASAQQRRSFDALFGNKTADASAIQTLRQVIIESGA